MDPETGILYQNRGSYFSLDPDHANVLAPGKRTLHTLLPGMLFRDAGDGRGQRPWIVVGGMGGDAQPQVHAQFVSAVVDGGVDIRTAVSAPRWFIESADHFAPPTTVLLEPRHHPDIAPALADLGHDVQAGPIVRPRAGPRACDRVRGRRPGVAGRFAGRRDRPAQRGSAGRLVAAVCDTRGQPVAGERSHDAATGVVVPGARQGRSP